MPTTRYVELSLNDKYFQPFLASAKVTDANPTFDRSLIDHLQVPIKVLQKTIFQYNNSKMNIHKDKITSKSDMFDAISEFLIDHDHHMSADNVASVFAVLLSRYYFYQKWFTLLNHPLPDEDSSELVLDFVTNNDVFDIHLKQKESKLGTYTERHIGSSTVFKAKQELHLNISSKQLISAKNIAFSISKQLWDNGLQAAANEYLNRLGTNPFKSDDILVLTPFLTNQAFLTTYSQRYANQTLEIQAQARNAIENCFSADSKQEILMVLQPFTAVVASVAPPSRPISSNSTLVPVTLISDAKSASIIPVAPNLSPEEDFTTTYLAFKNYVKFESYEASQSHYIQELADAISSLKPKEREKNYSLLADVMRKAQRAVEAPGDTDNLEASAALLKPLKTSSMHRVALAVTAIVVGALIVAASLAVALASFGVTTAPSVLGISIGSGLLTKGIAIAAGVIGLAVSATGFRLFSHRPYKPVTDNVDRINKVALDYNAHQPRMVT